MKQCSLCQRVLDLTDFGKNRSRKSGLHPHCKDCVSKYNQKRDKPRINAQKRSAWATRLANDLCGHCGGARLLNSNHYCEWHYFSDVAKSRLGKAGKGTIEALRARFYENNCLCPYTNEVLVLGVNASLDHKLPVSRYPEEKSNLNNVEWVCSRANDAKGNMTTQEFIDFCHTVARLNPID